jgi:hypothetical protein
VRRIAIRLGASNDGTSSCAASGRRGRRVRQAALLAVCRCSQRCTRVSSQMVTLNRIHGERSRWGRKIAPGASMMPSRCEASANVSESSICGNRAQRRRSRRSAVRLDGWVSAIAIGAQGRPCGWHISSEATSPGKVSG